MTRVYPRIPETIAALLAAVEPTDGDFNAVYYPCAVTLISGEVLPCVYLSEAKSWHQSWGVWPENDRGKRSVSLSQVILLERSPLALPARFANQLFKAGESGMGYTIFTVVFRDGSSAAYVTGNVADFVTWPKGKTADDVTDVLPHEGRNRKDRLTCPEYFWCLYST